MMQPVAQAHRHQRPFGSRPALPLIHSGEDQRKLNVFQRGLGVEQIELLKYKTQPAAAVEA